jgi:iron-sulfur cluster assembly accessory protein
MTTLIQNQAILLTPAAAEVVKGLRQKQNLDESYCLRIYITGQTCSGFQYGMALDNNLRESDSTFDCEGLKIIVDEASIQYMGGATINYIDDERGIGFLVENPNVVPSCSCESGTCGQGEK